MAGSDDRLGTADPVDFGAGGLVGGLEGPAREARLALLRRLLDESVELASLRAAVADERLALLPVDRVLGGEARYTAMEVAAETGVDPHLLVDALAAFGLPPIDPASGASARATSRARGGCATRSMRACRQSASSTSTAWARDRSASRLPTSSASPGSAGRSRPTSSVASPGAWRR